jgi:hypothetical protein
MDYSDSPVEDSYIDEFSKLALALTSGQLAKRAFVADLGIGEDLNFNFIGWLNNKVVIILQLDKKYMRIDPEQRFQKCAAMCMALRRYWGIDGVTMIAEGWCSKDPQKTEGLDLAKAFVNKENDVQECLTIVHSQINNDDNITVTVMASPYEYSGGRTIEFHDLIFYSEGGVNIVRDKKYPAMLYKCLSSEVEYDVERYTLDEVSDAIMNNGFHIQEFY